MANNLIQIKRSLNTANASGLANGELAFTSNGDVLWIGANGATLPIAGKRFPGTLTANQALVANSTSGIDNIKTANLTLSGTSVDTINTVANLTHLGAAGNNELTSTWAIKTFVDAKIASASNPQGSNGQFQYNDEGVLAGTPNMTYDKTTNTVSVGNSSAYAKMGYNTTLQSVFEGVGDQNNYVMISMQNANTGTAASADVAVYNDDATFGTFIDMGITSTTWANTAWTIGGANDGYLYTGGGNLTIGTNTAGKYVSFFTGGGLAANERMRVDGDGNVAIGTTTADAKLKVSGTANITGLTTISGNLVLGASLSANGSGGTGGYVLKSGGTGNVYWDAISASVAGTNTQIQFNDGGALAGATGFTYDKNTNNVSIANSLNIPANGAYGNATTGGTLVNSTSFASGNSTANTIHTGSKFAAYSNSLTLGQQNATINSISLNIQDKNSLANLVPSSIRLQDMSAGSPTGYNSGLSSQYLSLANNSQNILISNYEIVIDNGSGLGGSYVSNTFVANNDGVFLGANVVANSTGYFVGNTTANLAANSGTFRISSNSTVNSTHTAALLQVANSTTIANVTAAGIQAYTNATVNAIFTASFIQVANATATSNLTAQGLAAGANVVANTTTLKVGNTTLTTTNAIFGGTIAANGGVGTAGQVLISGGAANASWSNSLGVFSFTDVTVSGNLTVLGDLVSLNVATLAVEDPLIALAKNQSNTSTYTDAVDIGFYGTYGNTNVADKNWTGFFRDQSDSGVYKLFSGNIPEPTTTVDTTNTNFTYATFQAQLKTGGAGAAGFISNATHIAITANSTLNVAIVANTLSLSTALPVTSGGIGLNSVAVGDLLVGNSTNTLTRLASGTDGYVLQINGTGVVAWNTLDGGTF